MAVSAQRADLGCGGRTCSLVGLAVSVPFSNDSVTGGMLAETMLCVEVNEGNAGRESAHVGRQERRKDDKLLNVRQSTGAAHDYSKGAMTPVVIGGWMSGATRVTRQLMRGAQSAHHCGKRLPSGANSRVWRLQRKQGQGTKTASGW